MLSLGGMIENLGGYYHGNSSMLEKKQTAWFMLSATNLGHMKLPFFFRSSS